MSGPGVGIGPGVGLGGDGGGPGTGSGVGAGGTGSGDGPGGIGSGLGVGGSGSIGGMTMGQSYPRPSASYRSRAAEPETRGYRRIVRPEVLAYYEAGRERDRLSAAIRSASSSRW